MSRRIEDMLTVCLYFTVNSLARKLNNIAEEAFVPLGMTPSYAFLLLLVIEKPGSTINDLAKGMHLAPSTVSRFVDALKGKSLVSKEHEGRKVLIQPTPSGNALHGDILECWHQLHVDYSDKIGEDFG